MQVLTNTDRSVPGRAGVSAQVEASAARFDDAAGNGWCRREARSCDREHDRQTGFLLSTRTARSLEP